MLERREEGSGLLRAGWKRLLAAAGGAVLGPLDGSIVVVALPAIASDFGVGPSTVSWVSAAFFLVVSALLLTVGRLADSFGHRRTYLLGLAIFASASALCGLAWSFAVLVTLRVVQALGSTMVDAVSPGAAVNALPARLRGRALGIRQMMVAFGLVMGPTIGGFLLREGSWRLVFVVGVPIAVAAGIAIWRWAPPDTFRPREPFDGAGALLLALAIAPLLVYLSRGPQVGWVHPALVAVLAVSPITMLWLVRHERRVPHPILDMRWFGDRAVKAAAASGLLAYAGSSGIAFLLPFLMTLEGRFSPVQIGLLVAVQPAALVVTAPIGGVLAERVGVRVLTTVGMAVTSAGALSFAWLGAQFSPLDASWRMALVGVGFGLFEPSNIQALLAGLPTTRLGLGGGVLATARNLGLASGVALAGGLFGARLGAYRALYPMSPSGDVDDWLSWLRAGTASPELAAFRDAMLIVSILALSALVVSLYRGSVSPPNEGRSLG